MYVVGYMVYGEYAFSVGGKCLFSVRLTPTDQI
jgi:hypothetical protein